LGQKYIIPSVDTDIKSSIYLHRVGFLNYTKALLPLGEFLYDISQCDSRLRELHLKNANIEIAFQVDFHVI